MFESVMSVSPWVRDSVAVAEATSIIPGVALALLILLEGQRKAGLWLICCWMLLVAFIALLGAVSS